jgi:hypothetical protein
MLRADGRPWDGVESFRIDRRAVHGAPPERALVDSPECISHLLQSRGVELRFGEGFALVLVGHARVGDVTRRGRRLRSSRLLLAIDSARELLFEAEQAALVVLYLHVVSSGDGLPRDRYAATTRRTDNASMSRVTPLKNMLIPTSVRIGDVPAWPV